MKQKVIADIPPERSQEVLLPQYNNMTRAALVRVGGHRNRVQDLIVTDKYLEGKVKPCDDTSRHGVPIEGHNEEEKERQKVDNDPAKIRGQDTEDIGGSYSYPLVDPRPEEVLDTHDCTVVQSTGAERSLAPIHVVKINPPYPQHTTGGARQGEEHGDDLNLDKRLAKNHTRRRAKDHSKMIAKTHTRKLTKDHTKMVAKGLTGKLAKDPAKVQTKTPHREARQGTRQDARQDPHREARQGPRQDVHQDPHGQGWQEQGQDRGRQEQGPQQGV